LVYKQSPPPPGNFNPFLGESMGIFWDCTMYNKLVMTFWMLRLGLLRE